MTNRHACGSRLSSIEHTPFPRSLGEEPIAIFGEDLAPTTPLTGSNFGTTASHPDVIDELPVDLMVLIFQHVIHGHESQTYVTLLHTLAQVSRRWSAIVKGTAVFWTHITSAYTPALVRSILKLSKDALLHLKLDLTSWHGEDPVSWPVLGEHIHRWRSLTALAPGPHGLAFLKTSGLLESKDAAELWYLDVGTHSPYATAWIGLDLFGGQLSQLRTLILRGITLLDWSSLGSATRLRAFRLVGLGTEAPDLLRLLAILPLCISLEDLQLERCDFPSPASTSKGLEFILPNLHIFLLSDVAFEGSLYILRTLSAPSCTNLTFEPKEDIHWSQLLKDALSPYLASVLKATSPGGQRLVNFDLLGERNRVDLAVFINTARISSFALDTLGSNESITWMIKEYTRLVLPTDEASLTLSGQYHQIPALDVIQGLKSLPGLVKLRLSGFHQSALETILEELSRVEESISGEPTPRLCPILSELRVDSSKFLGNALLSFARTRFRFTTVLISIQLFDCTLPKRLHGELAGVIGTENLILHHTRLFEKP